jgi:hypothetical protein
MKLKSMLEECNWLQVSIVVPELSVALALIEALALIVVLVLVVALAWMQHSKPASSEPPWLAEHEFVQQHSDPASVEPHWLPWLASCVTPRRCGESFVPPCRCSVGHAQLRLSDPATERL